MKANGKADLYFHAYFWEKYLRQLNDGPSQGKKKKQILKKLDQEDDVKSDDDESGPSSQGGNDLFSGKYPFMKRLIGLSATLSKVIVNIKKFPFHEKMYHKYAKEFG
jgi:hypothetical protein